MNNDSVTCENCEMQKMESRSSKGRVLEIEKHCVKISDQKNWSELSEIWVRLNEVKKLVERQSFDIGIENFCPEKNVVKGVQSEETGKRNLECESDERRTPRKEPPRKEEKEEICNVKGESKQSQDAKSLGENENVLDTFADNEDDIVSKRLYDSCIIELDGLEDGCLKMIEGMKKLKNQLENEKKRANRELERSQARINELEARLTGKELKEVGGDLGIEDEEKSEEKGVGKEEKKEEKEKEERFKKDKGEGEEEESEKSEELEKDEKESEKKEKVEAEEMESEKKMGKEESSKEVVQYEKREKVEVVQDEKKEKERRKDVQKKLPGEENKSKKEKSVVQKSKPKSGRNKGSQGKRKKYALGGKKKWGKKKKKYKKKGKSKKSKKMSALEVKYEEDRLLEKMRIATEKKLAKMKERNEKKTQETNNIAETNKEMHGGGGDEVDLFVDALPSEILKLYEETGTSLSIMKETLGIGAIGQDGDNEWGVRKLRELAHHLAWGIGTEIKRVQAVTIFQYLKFIGRLEDDVVSCVSHGLLLIGDTNGNPAYCVVRENQELGQALMSQAAKLIRDKIKNDGIRSLSQVERVIYWKMLVHERKELSVLDDKNVMKLIEQKKNQNQSQSEFSDFENYLIGTTFLGIFWTKVLLCKEPNAKFVRKDYGARTLRYLHASSLPNAAADIVCLYHYYPYNMSFTHFSSAKAKGDYLESVLKPAAERGEPHACIMLAKWYEYGLDGVMGDDEVLLPSDFEKAIEYYERAKGLGHLYALRGLLRTQEKKRMDEVE